MAKKIRFPLEMENGVEVRSMEGLRDNFSIFKVISYLKEGKLVIWLRDRYENDVADSVEKLDLQDEELAKKLCELFDVPYDENTEKDMEKASKRMERIMMLKNYTDDKQYEAVIDNVAFNQDELYDLLDEEEDTIYLCGEKFSIPLSKGGVRYIGINSPIAVIDSKAEVDWDEKNIVVENAVFDKKYQAILDDSRKEEEEIFKNQTSETGYEIKCFEIPEELFDKYGIYIKGCIELITNADGSNATTINALVDKKNPVLEKCIQIKVIDFAEDDKNLYILSEWLLEDAQYACSIYDKATHSMKVSPIQIKRPFHMGGSSLYIKPERKEESIDTEHILFFVDKELKWVKFDGSDERCIYSIESKDSDPILIKDSTFYYGKYNGDGTFMGLGTIGCTHAICSFDVHEGRERVICPATAVAYDSQYMYILVKVPDRESYHICQFDFASGCIVTPQKQSLESSPRELFIQNDYLFCEYSGGIKKRISEIVYPYGIASKEECEAAGFFKQKKKHMPEKQEISNVKLLDNGVLIAWRGDYSSNRQIIDNCDEFVQQGDDVYYRCGDGTFGKYNTKTGEGTVFDILVEYSTADKHSFCVSDDIVYFKARLKGYGEDYGKEKKLFALNTHDKSVQVVPYVFDEEIYNIVNYKGTVFVHEGVSEKNVIYRNKSGKWRILLEEVRAYCFADDFIYYVKDDISRDGYNNSSYHVFYKLNLETREEYKISEVKFDTSGVSENGDGLMEKIEVKDNKILYQEHNMRYGRVKEIKM